MATWAHVQAVASTVNHLNSASRPVRRWRCTPFLWKMLSLWLTSESSPIVSHSAAQMPIWSSIASAATNVTPR